MEFLEERLVEERDRSLEIQSKKRVQRGRKKW